MGSGIPSWRLEQHRQVTRQPHPSRSRTAALLLALLCLPATAGTLTVKGSDTMVQLTQRWAEALMEVSPSVKVQVTGGGSGTGLAALENGSTDIATSSRPMTRAEREKLLARWGVEPVEVVVARDAVSFYVSTASPVRTLSLEQLELIYLGDVTRWSEVGGPDAPIIVYSRESSSGTYAFLKERLLHGQDFTVRAQLLPGTAAVVNAVALEKGSIGYGGAAHAKGVVALKVSAGGVEVEPNAETVATGRYPLARDLFFYLRGPPSADAQAFIALVLSKAGQQQVAAAGYFEVSP